MKYVFSNLVLLITSIFLFTNVCNNNKFILKLIFFDYLDIRLKKINDERNGYINKINSLKLELQEAKNHIGEEYSDCDNFEDAQSK